MRPCDLRQGPGASHSQADPEGMLRQANAFRLEVDLDAFRFEDLENSGGDAFIFAMNEARPHFDDGDLAAEAPVHLAEFEADVAATHDHQMLREKVHGHNG